MMNFKIHCLLLILTLCVREGLTEEYEAHLGAKTVLLQVRVGFLCFVWKVFEGEDLYYGLEHDPLRIYAKGHCTIH